MTTKAIEAGARAVINAWEAEREVPFPLYDREADAIAKACIEAAIASGELVPASKALPYNSAEFLTTPESLEAYTKEVVASAVAAERERCARLSESCYGVAEGDLPVHVLTGVRIAAAIRALEPASGEYVLVPRVPTQAMIDAGYWPAVQRRGAKSVWSAMLTAATSNGSGK